VVGTSLEQLKDKIGTRKISIDIPKGLPEVLVDFLFMLKALFNLIDNAIKYSPDNSPIEIRVSLAKDKVKIAIKDYGCGIPREDLEHIFEKFYRGKRSQPVSGTGLGLCISKGIIEAHGGKIAVESDLGRGTTVTVEIPVR